MNSWAFTGNLGRDAERRQTGDTDAVVVFSVAVKAGYGRNESTTWVRCQLWGKRADAVEKFLVKGQLVGIVGEARMREWQGKDGVTRKDLEVRVSDLTLLGKREGDQVQQPAAPNQQTADDDWQNDIPF